MQSNGTSARLQTAGEAVRPKPPKRLSKDPEAESAQWFGNYINVKLQDIEMMAEIHTPVNYSGQNMPNLRR